MANDTQTAPKLSFTFDPALSQFDVSEQAYRDTHDNVEAVASGALVFAQTWKSAPILATPTAAVTEDGTGTIPGMTALPTDAGTKLVTDALPTDKSVQVVPESKDQEDRELQDVLLLIQRAHNDSMPLRWETPGGAVDREDPTVLYGMARELWEEAGLKAKHVIREVGPYGFFFFTRRGVKVHKFSFEVEVETATEKGASAMKTADGELTLPTVTLSDEHEGFMWVTEEECRAHKVGDVEFKFTHLDQEQTVLEGFRARKERLAKQKSA
jgi:8-oxo-dGTP pyrophosphatase MutT (NUDIX family)